MLADAQVAQLRFLEIRVDPDVLERADGHQALPDEDVVAGIHVAACDHPVDLRDDLAVAQIEVGLVEIALRLFHRHLRLLHRGRVLDHLGINAVDVALRVAPVEFGHGIPGRQVVGRGHDAELPGAVHQIGQSDADRGETLVEIGRHIVEALALRHRDRQAEAGPRFVDILQCLVDLRLGHVERGLLLLHVLGADRVGGHQLLGAGEFRLSQHERRLGLVPLRGALVQQRDLVVHQFDGVLQSEAFAAHLGHLRAHVGLGGDEIGFRGIDRRLLDVHLHLVRLGIEFDEQVAFLHTIIVVDQHARHLPTDAWRNESHVAIHISVVGRDRVQGMDHPRHAVEQRHRNKDQADDHAHPTGFARRGRRRWGRGLGRGRCRYIPCLRRWRSRVLLGIHSTNLSDLPLESIPGA